MKQVDTGISPYIWATDLNQAVYLFNEEERSFQQIPGHNLVHVTSGEAGVIFITNISKSKFFIALTMPHKVLQWQGRNFSFSIGGGGGGGGCNVILPD